MNMDYESAVSVIESCYGFTDSTSTVGEAWEVVQKHIAALKAKNAEQEKELREGDYWRKRAVEAYSNGVCPCCHEWEGHTDRCELYLLEQRIAALEDALGKAYVVLAQPKLRDGSGFDPYLAVVLPVRQRELLYNIVADALARKEE